MALTNVWRRGSDGEWERTTAAQEDAERDYSVFVKAASYRCYSCFQYVTFVKGSVSRASHFKHSRGDVNKDCEDRSQYSSRSIDYIPSDMPMPMRLSIQGGHALFQIGLLPIGDDELNRATAAKLTVIGVKAFKGCRVLCEINMPNDLVEVGENAFDGCWKLGTMSFSLEVRRFGSES